MHYKECDKCDGRGYLYENEDNTPPSIVFWERELSDNDIRFDVNIWFKQEDLLSEKISYQIIGPAKNRKECTVKLPDFYNERDFKIEVMRVYNDENGIIRIKQFFEWKLV